MNRMSRYYISRALVSIGVGGLLFLTGSPWWVAGLMGLVVFSFFLWAPRSGRYAVHPKRGATALQRDERTQMVNDKAARNAFVVIMLAVAGIAITFGRIAPADVPVLWLNLVLGAGFLTYFVSDFVLRRC